MLLVKFVLERYHELSMEKPNPIREKSYSFAIDVVIFCKEILIKQKKEYVISKQLIKSGTSIGANVEEAINAPSKKDFVNKLSIALKESYESRYWIFLLRDTHYVDAKEVQVLLEQMKEIIALLTAIIKTSRESLE